jgi:hypothetical protein
MQTENAKLKKVIREGYSKTREETSGLIQEFKRRNLEFKNALREEIIVEYEKPAKKWARGNGRFVKKFEQEIEILKKVFWRKNGSGDN